MLILFIFKDSDDADNTFRDVDIRILLVDHEGSASLKIIIEGEVVMGNISDLPKAMCILLRLTYTLHLNYPKSMKLTFEFIQQVLLSLGHTELKPKLQTLKNQLTI